jgi:hypothetical protein
MKGENKMKISEFEEKYWNYYLHLEEKFMHISSFVHFDSRNFNVFSYEFVSLFQNIGAEIDLLFKKICGYSGNDNRTMRDYKNDIIYKCPEIKEKKIKVNYFNIEIQPFEKLESGMTWWKEYNAIKHNRLDNISKANLENVLEALAALFLLERYLLVELKEEDSYVLIKQSNIFRIDGVDIQPRMQWKVDSDKGIALVYNDDLI